MTTVGLISDTHGLVRPEALQALAGSDFIIHAGDIGDRTVLEQLHDIAPVIAVRGNNDIGAWASDIPETDVLEVEQVRFLVLHSVKDLRLDPLSEGFHAVISGHSHKPEISTRDGVTFINPGSAGPRRFHLPISLASVVVRGAAMSPRLIQIEGT